MGTNYYLVSDPDPVSEDADAPRERHIGKSSVGWCFSLHVYPDEGIKTLDDWIPLLNSGAIRDEYETPISRERMIEIITYRSAVSLDSWNSAQLTRNHAVRGPNGLMRHAIDGRFCIGHGVGTWDYLIGVFC